MADTLRVGADRDDIHARFGDALGIWNATTSATLRVANRVYAERTATPEPAYVALTRDAYQAPIEFVDFIESYEPVRLQINDWVADTTVDRIRDLLPPDSLNSRTRFVLVNAIYFKGDWARQFDPEDTQSQLFLLAEGDEVDVQMMNLKHTFGYAEREDGWKILDMPYLNDELSMVWLLPKQRGGLAELEADLSADLLQDLRRHTRRTEVEVAIPRFKMEPPALSMKSPLMQLGMMKAFDPDADFTGIADLPDGLYISEVFHKAFIEVNEEGSEAAAATAIVMETKMAIMPEALPPRFIADHPFIFALIDNRTQVILFMGRVSDPR
jgi:serpin B